MDQVGPFSQIRHTKKKGGKFFEVVPLVVGARALDLAVGKLKRPVFSVDVLRYRKRFSEMVS